MAKNEQMLGVFMTRTRTSLVLALILLVQGFTSCQKAPVDKPTAANDIPPVSAPDNRPPPIDEPASAADAPPLDEPASADAAPPAHPAHPVYPAARDEAPDARNYTVVPVFFATDRKLTTSTIPAEMFAAGRAPIHYGICTVSVPNDHKTGELESPSIWRLEFRENPAKHVVLLDVVVQSKDTFFADVAAQVRASRTTSAFLFVHGYNVTFADAARRTAQISYDLAFDGAPVFYSWPSQGESSSYMVDEQSIEWAQSNIKGFLDDFLSRSDAQNVYLIAHSMGSRAVTRAVAALLAEKPALRERLKEIILAAPDIDADVFKRDIAPALIASGRPITLYASSTDVALVASKKVHGYARAGDAGQGIVVLQGIDSIDATNVNTSFLGHSYYAENRSVIADLRHLIRESLRPDQRSGLRAVDAQSGRYWVIQ